jgi:hypothetical protein
VTRKFSLTTKAIHFQRALSLFHFLCVLVCLIWATHLCSVVWFLHLIVNLLNTEMTYA